MFVILVGETGVGGAGASNGQVLQGVRGGAGEVGHVGVRGARGRCSCGNADCLETVGSVQSLLRRSVGKTSQPPKSLEELVERVERGEKEAVAAVRRCGKAIGHGAATVLNLENPRALVVYGPRDLVEPTASAAGQIFDHALRRTCRKRAYSSVASDCEITTRALERETIAIGSAIFALAANQVAHDGIDTVEGASAFPVRVYERVRAGTAELTSSLLGSASHLRTTGSTLNREI
jgi:predicted NBD/HSP70 family sugar kinase